MAVRPNPSITHDFDLGKSTIQYRPKGTHECVDAFDDLCVCICVCVRVCLHVQSVTLLIIATKIPFKSNLKTGGLLHFTVTGHSSSQQP